MTVAPARTRPAAARRRRPDCPAVRAARHTRYLGAWPRDRPTATATPLAELLPRSSSRRSPPGAARRLRRAARARPEARPHPGQARLGPARPVRRAARPAPTAHTDADGIDVRNYGGLHGLARAARDVRRAALGRPRPGGRRRQLQPDDDARRASSTSCCTAASTHRGRGRRRRRSRFVCPVPGYDRHFTMLESFGIEMVTVPMLDDGPDADGRRGRSSRDDPSVKGMWIVPTYANPAGSVSPRRSRPGWPSMPTAAPDFKIFWDNAYALPPPDRGRGQERRHPVAGRRRPGHPHRPIMFASTSQDHVRRRRRRVPRPRRRETVAWYLGHLPSARRSGPTRSTSCATLQFFGSAQGVRDHMVKHREILAPKFAAVERVLTERLAGLGVAAWTTPAGGYFVSLDVLDGTRVARRRSWPRRPASR